MAAHPKIDESPHSRRRILSLGILGGAATFFVRSNTASAADGDPLLLGQANDSPNQTALTSGDANIFFGNQNGGPDNAVDAWIDGGGSNIGVNGGVGGGGGTGVRGYIDGNGGVAVVADARQAGSGDALHVFGAAMFSTAGLATIPKGKSSLTISPGVTITATTKVLATLQSGGGTLVRVGRNTAGDTVTFYLTKAATEPVTVAYFIIS